MLRKDGSNWEHRPPNPMADSPFSSFLNRLTSFFHLKPSSAFPLTGKAFPDHLEQGIPLPEPQEQPEAVNRAADNQLPTEAGREADEILWRVQELSTRRGAQLAAVAQVAREAAAIRDLNELLSRATHLISEHFGVYHVGIFLLNEAGEYAVLRAANSPGGQQMLARQHRLSVGQVGIVGYVAGTSQPRIALDVGEDAIFFDNRDLPETRSEMALPLLVHQNLIGVLDVQSTQPMAFTPEDVEVVQILADQIALAIDNARLFQESQQAFDALRTLYDQQVGQAWSERLAKRPAAFYYDSAGVRPLPSGMPPPTSGEESVSRQAIEGHLLKSPIVLRGQALGTLTLRRDPETEPWTELERQMVSETLSQIALALENARLLEEAGWRIEREHLVSEVATRIRQTLDIEVVLQTAVRAIAESLDIPEVEVRLGNLESSS